MVWIWLPEYWELEQNWTILQFSNVPLPFSVPGASKSASFKEFLLKINVLFIAVVREEANFPCIHFLLFLVPPFPLSFSSGTFFDSGIWIGLFPADCPFFGLVLWSLPFFFFFSFLNHLSSQHPLLKKKMWILIHGYYLLCFLVLVALWLLKSSTAVSSAQKEEAELRQGIHSLSVHINGLRG